MGPDVAGSFEAGEEEEDEVDADADVADVVAPDPPLPNSFAKSGIDRIRCVCVLICDGVPCNIAVLIICKQI